MAKSNIKKSMGFLLIVLILSAFAWGTYLWLAPDNSQHQLSEAKTKYTALQDSIQALDYQIRTVSEPQIVQLQKDRLTFFQKQVEITRKQITELSTGKIASSGKYFSLPSLQLPKNPLTQILLWISIALALFAIILYILIKRRSKPKPIKMDQIKEANSQKSGTTQLEELLARLQSQAPVAQPSQRVKNSTQVTSPHSETSQPSNFDDTIRESEIQHATPAEDITLPQGATSNTDLQDLDQIQESHFQTGPEVSANFHPTPSPKFDNRPKEEEIFPSSLNRLDQEDREKSDVLKLARRGYTSSEIARRLKLSQDQVEFIIRLQRDKG